MIETTSLDTAFPCQPCIYIKYIYIKYIHTYLFHFPRIHYSKLSLRQPVYNLEIKETSTRPITKGKENIFNVVVATSKAREQP